MKKRFCPKCGSDNVKKNMNALDSSLGIYSDWVCNDCGFIFKEFPLKEVRIKKNQKK